jgi:hypothetical protein
VEKHELQVEASNGIFQQTPVNATGQIRKGKVEST